MRGKLCYVIGYSALDPLGLHGGVLMLSRCENSALPLDRVGIWRQR
jgi:hypothetical protein